MYLRAWELVDEQKRRMCGFSLFLGVVRLIGTANGPEVEKGWVGGSEVYIFAASDFWVG